MTIKDSTLRINVDVDKAEAKAKQLAHSLDALGISGTSSGQQIQTGMTQAGNSIQQAGDKAAAAQIRFQTMTQGMLNLSTAAVQTYTSTSNLDRVMVKAKASNIAHERSLDTLARKQFQLNKEMERSVPNYEKISLLKNEIKTATENETVALDKMKIAQQDVTDVQLLFVANIANVGVSSLQTFTRLLGETRTAMIYNTLATKFDTIARFNNSHAIGGNLIQRRLDTLTLYTNTGALAKTTIATKLQTVALHGLKIALGPIGLIFIGISAAMAAYETNAFGLKDTINGLLGIHDDLNDTIEEGTDVLDEQSKSTDKLSGSMNGLSESMRLAVKQSKDMQQEFLQQQITINGSVSSNIANINQLAQLQGQFSGFKKGSNINFR